MTNSTESVRQSSETAPANASAPLPQNDSETAAPVPADGKAPCTPCEIMRRLFEGPCGETVIGFVSCYQAKSKESQDIADCMDAWRAMDECRKKNPEAFAEVFPEGGDFMDGDREELEADTTPEQDKTSSTPSSPPTPSSTSNSTSSHPLHTESQEQTLAKA
mmetsp:Transcript_12497/g.20379  ORF Transcript_12497/g.20379 Transcript_12497/m.20379 type:complete len:162 (-) Transcript_12497:38-523(-)|eukprot:CAMPEP_0184675710 /NCGR_PEP_ID=MMETSP0308-20130426/87939_1 /TAXON_ID=38269 /ORGANISM="Gloeochaete witrockiana, Strain SAG 46.84" /LENGTH=161 /DNA_ID=CAMNT_0027123447 /DNA_START=33 /DNA_END=518 /DNA_ORIENTATION=+